MVHGPTDRHAATAAELRERLRAARAGLPFLVYRDPGSGQVIMQLPPERDHLTIGRGPDNDVVLRWDAEVSRVHAELQRIGPDWAVCDEGLSHNGTYVNGDRVLARRRLRHGDVIAVGRTLLAVEIPAGGGHSSTRTSIHPVTIELTPAQRRVLVALCRPMAAGRYAAPATNRAIADELVLSIDTVKGTLTQLFEVFGLDEVPQNAKRATLATAALDTGVVHREDL
jgi:hypothetical protein